LAVIDIDPKNGGNFREEDKCYVLISASGKEYKVPKTRRVKTGGGGYHLYYSGALKLPAKLDDGIDFKSTGGYVIAPPSIHESGNTYQLVMDIPIVPFPKELLEQQTKESDNLIREEHTGYKYKNEVRQGTRNTELISYVGHCTRYEIPLYDATQFALLYNEVCFRPPLTESEVVKIIKNGYKEYQDNLFYSHFKLPIPDFEPLHPENEEYYDTTQVEPEYYCDYADETPHKPKPSVNGFSTNEGSNSATSSRTWDKRKFSAAELIMANIPETKWAIPNLIPEGLTLIGGRPKVGKSWLALQMVHAVSTGGSFLGEKVDHGKCLYYALEDNAKRLQNRSLKQGITEEADITFVRELKPLQGEGYLELLDEITQGNYKLIVIDTFTRAFSGLDQNDQPKISELMNKLQKLCSEKNVALVFLDHTSKPKGLPSDPINDIMNSTVKVAVADQILGLYRENGKAGTVLKGRGREIEEIHLSLSWDKEKCRWLLVGETDDVNITPERKRIIEALEFLGKAQSVTVANHLGKDKSNTNRALNLMYSLGLIDRDESDGKIYYKILEKVDTTPTTDTTMTTMTTTHISTNRESNT